MPLGFTRSDDDRSSTHPVHHFDRRVLSVRLGWFGLLLGLCLGLSWYLTHTLVLYGASIERNGAGWQSGSERVGQRLEPVAK